MGKPKRTTVSCTVRASRASSRGSRRCSRPWGRRWGSNRRRGPVLGSLLVIGRLRAADAGAGGDPGAARGTRASAREKGLIGGFNNRRGRTSRWGVWGVREARERTHSRGGAREDPESVANIFSVGFVVNARVLCRRRRDRAITSCPPLSLQEASQGKSAVSLRFADFQPTPAPGHRKKSRRSASTRFDLKDSGVPV